MTRMTRFCVLASIVLAQFVSPNEAFAQAGSWATKASLTTARTGLQAETVGGIVYAIGGATGGCPSPAALASEAYDPVTNTWAPKATLAQPPGNGGQRAEFATAVLNGKIYAFGGGNCLTFFRDVQVYDPMSDSWSVRPSMPTTRAYGIAAAVNGKIYVIGGLITSPGAFAPTYEYDPSTEIWTTKAAMPTPRIRPGAAVIGGKIYVVGGATTGPAGHPVATVEVYDPATDTWTSQAPMSTAREKPAVGVGGQRLYAFGGADSSWKIVDSGEAYDPASNSWSAAASMPAARTQTGMAVLGGVMYVIGGQSATVAGNTFAFTPPAPTETPTTTPAANFAWTPLAPTASQPVQFTDSSTGSRASWSWNFGDAVTSTLQNPTHTYTTAGTYSVSLTVTNAAGSNTVTKSITVSAAPPPSTPAITATPASRDFGSILVARTSDQTFTVTNSGSGTLSGTASVGAPFSIVSGGTYSLGAGQSQVVTVRFTPAQAGTFSGTVSFTGAAGATALVTGTGTLNPAISVSPASQDFGSVAVLGSSTRTFTVMNTGGGTLTGTATTSAPFSVVSGGSYSLGAGQSQAVTLKFSPTQAGSFNSSITFTGASGATAAVTGVGASPSGTSPSKGIGYSVTDRGGFSLSSDGAANGITVGFATIAPDPGQSSPAGIAIFGYRVRNVLVTEAGVPAAALLRRGRVYAEVSGALNTGIAIANPNTEPANVSFFFTDAGGNDFGAVNATIPPGGQMAKFVNEPPFNSGSNARGTLSFSSNVPVGVIALRGLTNERNEFLISTLPVVDTSASPSTIAAVLPHFADAGGWTTQIILVNPGDSLLSGTVQFVSAGGQAATLTVNGQTGSSFPFSIPPRSSVKLVTSGAGSSIQVGSVRVVPGSGNYAPSSLAIFSYNRNGVTVSEAAVPASSGNALRMYVEASGALEAPGTIQSGIAVANLSSSAASVNFELSSLNGNSLGSSSLSLPANGQSAKFLNEIFRSAPQPLQGVLRINSSAPISVVGLRGRYNERSDFLITTTPASDEAAPSSAAIQVFPHLANGGGYTTQFVLFSGSAGQSATGKLQFNQQNGGSLELGFAGLSELKVTKSGTGRVTSFPAGINCAGTCASGSALFTAGAPVTLTASEDPGSTFSGWSGDCSGSGKTCDLTMNGGKSVTATFDLDLRAGSTQVLQIFMDGPITNGTSGAASGRADGSVQLSRGSGTVTSEPYGITCGTRCGSHFARGMSIRLSARADPGSTFGGWSGACTTTADTCVVTLDTDKTVSVAFTKPSLGGEGGPVFGGFVGVRLFVYTFPRVTDDRVVGTVSFAPTADDCTNRDIDGCIRRFALGLPVVLTAKAAPGWVFTGWKGKPNFGESATPADDCIGKTEESTGAPLARCTVLAFRSGGGVAVEAHFASISSASPAPAPACAVAPVTFTANRDAGLITFLNIQRVFAGFIIPPLPTVTVFGVPIGTYTVDVVTTLGGLIHPRITVGCIRNTVIIRRTPDF